MERRNDTWDIPAEFRAYLSQSGWPQFLTVSIRLVKKLTFTYTMGNRMNMAPKEIRSEFVDL
jgi:hypothetical protein